MQSQWQGTSPTQRMSSAGHCQHPTAIDSLSSEFDDALSHRLRRRAIHILHGNRQQHVSHHIVFLLRWASSLVANCEVCSCWHFSAGDLWQYPGLLDNIMPYHAVPALKGNNIQHPGMCTHMLVTSPAGLVPWHLRDVIPIHVRYRSGGIRFTPAETCL